MNIHDRFLYYLLLNAISYSAILLGFSKICYDKREKNKSHEKIRSLHSPIVQVCVYTRYLGARVEKTVHIIVHQQMDYFTPLLTEF